jgi:hypothetical protein
MVSGDRLVKMLHQLDRYPDLKLLTDRKFLKHPLNNQWNKYFFKVDLLLQKGVTEIWSPRNRNNK